MSPTTSILKKLLTVSLATLIVTSTAQATNGIFITAETGTAKQTGLPPLDQTDATSLTNNSTPLAVRLGIGYNHDLTSYLGLGMNVGYGEYGESVYQFEDNESTKIRSKNLEFLALITTHIQKFDLIGKIGGVRQETDVTGADAPKTNHHNNTEAGIELAYNFSPKFAATATYAHVFGRTSDQIGQISNNTVSIDEYLLGVRYTFASS